MGFFWLYSQRSILTLFKLMKILQPARLYLVLFIFLTWVPVVRSQIYAPDANKILTTNYTSGFARVDTIFVVCSSDANGDPRTGTLNAKPPSGYSGVDFAWSKYNEINHNYDPPFFTETGVDESEAANLTSGGFRVRVADGVLLDTLFYAWLFIDTPYVETKIQNFTCEYLALRGNVQAAVFYYYDPGDQSQIQLQNGVRFEWTSEPHSDIPYPTLELNPVTYSPPYEDTWYYLTVTDSMGCTDRASLFYESINVKADMEPQPPSGEAPLEVTFLNNSVNAVKYKWFFGDDSISIHENPEPHIYFFPGEYEVVLAAESDAGCIDTMKYQWIEVEPSALEVPNVFTPNGDGYNDYFIVASISLRSIHVEVFSRNGRKVYEFEGYGEELRDWKGWDGKVSGGRYASPGVYYYIIEAVGWDNVHYESNIYHGFLHLIREK